MCFFNILLFTVLYLEKKEKGSGLLYSLRTKQCIHISLNMVSESFVRATDRQSHMSRFLHYNTFVPLPEVVSNWFHMCSSCVVDNVHMSFSPSNEHIPPTTRINDPSRRLRWPKQALTRASPSASELRLRYHSHSRGSDGQHTATRRGGH